MNIRKADKFNKKLNSKQRVAAYCRTSTKFEQQQKSLETQIKYFTKLITDNPNWEFAGIYADQNSAVKNKNRKEFNRMLEECRKGNVDIILTKSISRFSRNTLDLLITLKEIY